MELNQRIFCELRQQGKTAKELSTFINVSQSSVSAWKNDGSYPSSKFIVRISEFLGVSMVWLLTGEGLKYPSSELETPPSIWALQDYQRQAAEEYYANLTDEQVTLLDNYEKLTLPNRREMQGIIQLKLANQMEGQLDGRAQGGTA